jgi:LEA14-like dessication related protein
VTAAPHRRSAARARRTVSAVPGTTRAVALAVALVLLPSLPGCSTLADAGRALLPEERPTARIAAARLSDLSFEAITLTLDVQIKNPYDVTLPLAALDWRVGSGETALASGCATATPPLAARAETLVPVTARLGFDELLALLPAVKPGAIVPWSAAVDVALEAPVVGRLSLPLRADGELPVPALPEIAVANLRWHELSLSRAEGTLDLDLRNTNAFPFELRTLGFALSLGGSKVADASVTAGTSVAAHAGTRLDIPISFAPASIGVAILNLLKGESATYDLDGAFAIETPFGPLSAPFQRSGKVPFTR